MQVGFRVQGSGFRSAFHTARERLLTELSEELRGLEGDGLRRHLTSIDAIRGPIVTIDGRDVVCWCSNDYLGLSTHPALAEAAAQAARAWGVGARASRLLAGTTRWHTQLEDSLADWFGAERAVVYPSGYQANLGTLGALLSSTDAVFVDRLAHASLLDAARATRASFRVFHHNDPSHLRALLSSASQFRRRLVVTEGVFSMDGDRAPLAALVGAAEAHDALLYLDDAHGAFVCGATGRGTPEAEDVPLERVIYMGTLGKALGAQGGFVVGAEALIEYLHNRARPFMYTTALAVPVAAAAAEALRVLEREPERLVQLRARVERFSCGLAALGSRLQALGKNGSGLQPTASNLERSCLQPSAFSLQRPSQIQPVIVGDSRKALALADHLWRRGHWAPAIRPPTVPAGTARLRLSVTALHTSEQIDALIDALRDLSP